jgi:hypothetical protein
MPRVTTGNTMAQSVVIGERAAALLQEEHGASTPAAQMFVFAQMLNADARDSIEAKFHVQDQAVDQTRLQRHALALRR